MTEAWRFICLKLTIQCFSNLVAFPFVLYAFFYMCTSFIGKGLEFKFINSVGICEMELFKQKIAQGWPKKKAERKLGDYNFQV